MNTMDKINYLTAGEAAEITGLSGEACAHPGEPASTRKPPRGDAET